MSPQLVRLDAGDRDRAVALLAAAFHDYPVMRYTLGEPLEGAPRSSSYDARLRALVGFFCDKRLSYGWPVFALRGADRALRAVALVSPPEGGSTGGEPERARLAAQVGDDALARLDRYEEATDLDAPATPHHVLGVLGTDPACQGRGDGGLLLEAVARHADADPASSGVCLNTEVERNVGFYERHGFVVVGDRRVDAMRSWCMFRACPRGATTGGA